MNDNSTLPEAIVYFANASDGQPAGGSEEAAKAAGSPGESFKDKVWKLFGFANTKKVQKPKLGADGQPTDETEEVEEPFNEDDAYAEMENYINENKSLHKLLGAANEKLDSLPADAVQAGEALKLATAQVVELQAKVDELTAANEASDALIEEQDKTLSHYVESMANAAQKVETLTGEIAAVNEKLTKEHAAFVNERALRAKPLIAAAIEKGCLTLAEAPAFETSFANEDFDATATKLAALQPKLKTESKHGTENLGLRNSTKADPSKAGQQLNTMANEIFEAARRGGTAITYEAAYEQAKASKDGKPLYEAMVNESKTRKAEKAEAQGTVEKE